MITLRGFFAWVDVYDSSIRFKEGKGIFHVVFVSVTKDSYFYAGVVVIFMKSFV